jgi:hypothetical protein
VRKGVEIKGIGNAVLRTDGIVELKSLTEKHETVHNFHVLSEPSALQCDGILGRDFLEERGSVIKYCSRQIIMNNEVIINFDEKSCVDQPTPCKLTIKARSECIVYIPTHSQGLGLLDRAGLLPGVFLAASLTRGENGVCMTNIANTNEQDLGVILLPADLDIPDESESSLTLALSSVEASDSRLVRLRNFLRLKHLNR